MNAPIVCGTHSSRPLRGVRFPSAPPNPEGVVESTDYHLSSTVALPQNVAIIQTVSTTSPPSISQSMTER